MTRTRKIITASLAAITMSAAVAASSTPAAAWGWHHHHGWGYGGAGLAAGLIGGLAVGAIAASAAPDYGYGTCLVRQPAYDSWGNFIGYRRARVAC